MTEFKVEDAEKVLAASLDALKKHGDYEQALADHLLTIIDFYQSLYKKEFDD